jgi:hypothetical protein
MTTALGPLFEGLRLSLGDVSTADDFEFAAVVANEATADGRTVTIPAAKTGDNTSLFSFVRPGDEWAGAQLTFVTEFAVNEDFDRNLLPFTFRVRLADGSMDDRSGDAVTVATEDDGFRRISYAYTFDGDETQLEFCARLDAVAPAASEQTITLARLTASVDSVPDPLTTPTDAALDHRLARQADPLAITAPWILRYSVPLRPGVHAPEDTVMVSPGGGADFTSIADALAALSTPGTPVKRRAVEVAPGIYEETVEGKPRAFVDIMGRGARDDIKWQFYQDDSTSGADINQYSALSLFWSCRVENLFIDVLNARYGAHPESGGASFDAFWEFRGCRIRHGGNPSPNYDREGSHPIGFLDAVGAGISAGGYLLIEDCIFESATGRGIAVHNWPGQAAPSLLVVRRSLIKPGVPVEVPSSPGTFYPGGNIDMRIASLVSGQGDRAILEGNVFGRGMIEIVQDVGPAGAYPDFDVTGWGNSPALYAISDPAGYPRMTDEEAAPRNDTGALIPGKSVLAFDGDRQKVRLMTSADAGTLFAGVALENIADGTAGRVKVRGWLLLTDVLNTVGEALTFNATMSVGATPGSVEAGGAQGLLRAVRGDAVAVG